MPSAKPKRRALPGRRWLRHDRGRMPRVTGDIDLLVAVDLENERKVFSALSTLPDNAVRELQPGELQRYNVIRVADEIVVDLSGRAEASSTKRLQRMWSRAKSKACEFLSPRPVWFGA